MTRALLPAQIRPLLEPRLPEWVDARWWATPEEMLALAPAAEIGWFDLHQKPPVLAAVAAAGKLRWLNTAYGGVDWLPLADFARRGVRLSCGSGLTATSVAEFALTAMLAVAKDYPAVVRAQDRREWLCEAPGTRELAGSKALVMGMGAIGQAISGMLAGFGVEVVPVRRQAQAGALGPGEWQPRIGEFDWIVLALPGTDETKGLIGAREIGSMKPEAVLVNCARADIVDGDALTTALREKRIAAAILDVTDPEPLPPTHPLWQLDNAHITMHLSGIPTIASLRRGAERFARNCERFRTGDRLEAQVDLARGY